MIEFFKSHVIEFLGFIGMVFAYFFGKSKRNVDQKKVEVDIKNVEIKNLTDTFNLYERLLKNLEFKLASVSEDLIRLKTVHDRTKKLLEECKKTRYKLEKENEVLFKKLKTCQE